MAMQSSIFLLSLLGLAAAGPRVPESEWGPLDEYVWRPDNTYNWTEFREARIDDEGDIVHFLNMTSQTWMTNEFSNWPTWWHYQVVIIPEQLLYPQAALLFIGGGSSSSKIPTPDEDLITEALRLFADDVGCVVVYLKNIPNQPIIFNDDPEPGRKRTEDSQIAFTWRTFVEDPDNTPPEILSRMPMTKAVVRAMDATTEILAQEHGITMDKFVVGGGSKRGWTTWTTAAVDDRVIGQIPMVMSLLNAVPNVKKHFRSLGGWSFAFAPYYNENLTARIDQPETQKLFDIVDPYAYISRYTMPTMVISGTSDQFFLLDDSFFFFNDLPGTKMMFMQPGVDHSLAPWVETYINIRPFFVGVVTNYQFPQPTWTIDYDEGGCTLTMRTDGVPTQVMAYYAVTEDGTRRDWRLNKAGGDFNDVEWFDDADVQKVEEQVYRIRYDNPDPGTGWLAFLLEASYEGPGGYELSLTTEVAITPNTYPFEECQGSGCYGTLV